MKDVSLSVVNRPTDQYEEFLLNLQRIFDRANDDVLFTANAKGLFQIFLDGIPAEARQHYNCHACRDFIEKYGSLVTISPVDGSMGSALWSSVSVPEFFKNAVWELEVVMSKARVNGVFISSEPIWGKPVTGIWHHMSIKQTNGRIFNSSIQTAGQKMAEKQEEFRMLMQGLAEFPLAIVDTALTILRSDHLYRSEKCLGVAEWLEDLHVRRNATKDSKKKENIVWLAVATAPAGFCHVRSTMIGTLLEDIAAGLPFESIKKRFADKMHPLQYQRPSAAPTKGNVEQAEKIVQQLGVANSLKRRFARLDEIQSIWLPKITPEVFVQDGLFGHLLKEGTDRAGRIELPSSVMTWEKFCKNILPIAEEIEYHVGPAPNNYCAILTAVDPSAPPILQWDLQERRNPFSWYVYNNGSYPGKWLLDLGYRKVTAVCLQPSMWNDGFERHGKSVIFILDSAKDSTYGDVGIALFPETLKSEFHSIRSTIEAFSNNAKLEGYDEASACGIRLQEGISWNATFRVKSGNSLSVYKLDRWD